MGYVYAYLAANGFNFYASCGVTSQSGMDCLAVADNLSNHSKVYLTYVVSRDDNMVVGTYTQGNRDYN